MESPFMFDSQITSCVLLPSDMSMTSRLGKMCFLCNVKEIDGSSLINSQESSLLLCKVLCLNVPHMMNDLKKLENINYCHPCKERIYKIHESLGILKKLEEEVLDEKYFLRLQLETNHKVVRNKLHYSQWNFGVELVNEMRFKSIKSKLKKVVKNQIDRKFCSKTKNYRIMKDVTITERLKHGKFEEHISKETTPLTCNIISTEKQALINNSNFVDSPTNSPFNHLNLDGIKLEFLSEETNKTTDIKDPLEGIVPDSGFVTENSITRKMFICGTCETNFDDYRQLDEHSRTHIKSKSLRFSPNECVSKVSSNTNSCIDVINLLKCRYCDKIFPRLSNLKRHERTHSGGRPFKCNFCEKSFSKKSNMETHKRTHSGGRPFKCNFCEKSFSQKSNMETHKRIHTNEKPFTCGYCDKTFRNISNKKIHENIHKEKPFKCKYCEKHFSQKSHLETHERIHTLEKPFQCGYCGKAFRSLYNLKMHEYIHTAVKPFKCKFCEKGFSQKHSLESHKRIHTNEKPFKCGYCEKTFRDPSNLKSHEYIHKGKPFKCKCCKKNFSGKSHLENHESIHTNEKHLSEDTVTKHLEVVPL